MSDSTPPNARDAHDAPDGQPGWHEDAEHLLHEEIVLSSQNPARAGDAVMVHALLTLLAPGDAERTQARVRKAMSAIRSESSRRERFRVGRWVRRGTAAAVLAAASIALAILVFHVEETSATATLDRLLSTTAALTNRSYGVAIRETREQHGYEHRSTLTLGEGGRFRFESESGSPRMRPTFGYNGESFWMEIPGSRFVRSRDAGPLQALIAGSGLGSSGGGGGGDGGEGDDDDDAAVLTLESVLDTLRGGYDLDVSRGIDVESGRSILVVEATRRANALAASKESQSGGEQFVSEPPQRGADAEARGQGPGQGPGPGPGQGRANPRRAGIFGGRARPGTVHIEADPETFEVLSLVADWRDPAGGVDRQLVIELQGPHGHDASWFDPGAQGLAEVDVSEFRPGEWMGGRMRDGARGGMREGMRDGMRDGREGHDPRDRPPQDRRPGRPDTQQQP